MALFSLSLPPLSLPLLFYSYSFILFLSICFIFSLTLPLDPFLLTFSLSLFPLSSTPPFLCTHSFFFFSFSLHLPLSIALLCYHPPPAFLFIHSLVNDLLLSSLNSSSFLNHFFLCSFNFSLLAQHNNILQHRHL